MTAFHRLAAAPALLAGLAGGLAVAPAPALAQAARTGEIIVYGTDPCPRATDDQIVVCRRLPETQRFRIPEKLRPQPAPQTRNSWVNRSKTFANQGAIGPMSCSPVGPAGYTGCALQQINQAAREAKENAESETPPQ